MAMGVEEEMLSKTPLPITAAAITPPRTTVSKTSVATVEAGGIVVGCGCLCNRSGGKVTALSLNLPELFSLFDVDMKHAGGVTFRESATTVHGGDLVVADTPAGRIGLSICYDLRFPEVYRGLTDRGAQILADLGLKNIRILSRINFNKSNFFFKIQI